MALLTCILAVLVGLIAGTTSGLLGIGGGVVLIPLMLTLLKFDFRQAVIASLIVIIPTALSGVFGHLKESPITHWGLIILIVIGAIVGAQLGVYLCHWLSVPVLKKIFGLLLIFVAIKLIL
jgi:uncharacterized protein